MSNYIHGVCRDCSHRECVCKPVEPPPEVPCEFDPMFGRCRRTDVHACVCPSEVRAQPPMWERWANGGPEVPAPAEVQRLQTENAELRLRLTEAEAQRDRWDAIAVKGLESIKALEAQIAGEMRLTCAVLPGGRLSPKDALIPLVGKDVEVIVRYVRADR